MSNNSRKSSDWRSIIWHRLHSAAKSLDDLKRRDVGVDELHDARVAFRQAESVLRVARDLLPRRHTAWLRRELKSIRTRCNSARDGDVMQMWLEQREASPANGLLVEMKQQAMSERRKIARQSRSLLHKHRFVRHAKRVCRPPSRTEPIENWHPPIGQRLIDEFHRFLKAVPTTKASVRQLHQFRIAGKRLRYACEFVGEIVPAAKFAPFQAALKQIQGQLGELQDIRVRLKFLKHAPAGDDHRMLMRETEALQRQIAHNWQEWWRTCSFETVISSAMTDALRLIHPTFRSDPQRRLSRTAK